MEVLLAYLTLGGPFLVVVLDLIITRSTRRPTEALALLLALIGLVAAPLPSAGLAQFSAWLVLLPGVILLTHSGRMRGLGQFIAFFGWMMLCGLAIGQLAPQMRIAEVGFLPANLGFWIIPPLLLWHLWRVLPLAYDALRGGNWVEQGVPLTVRYGMLAVLTLLSLATALYFGWQWGEQRKVFAREASNELYSMWSALEQAEHWLSIPEWRDSPDWEEEVARHLWTYRRSAMRIISWVRLKNGMSSDSPLYFLSTTVPGRFLDRVERGFPLSEEEISAHSDLFKACKEALESALNSHAPLLLETYRIAADHILAELQGSDVLSQFDVQYKPQVPR